LTAIEELPEGSRKVSRQSLMPEPNATQILTLGTSLDRMEPRSSTLS
jgi:hypothetical protein